MKTFLYKALDWLANDGLILALCLWAFLIIGLVVVDTF